MTGSPRCAPHSAIVCCICAMPVRLETSKTDAQGHAVHEECYVRKISSKSRTGVAARLAENWLSSTLAKLQLRRRVADNC